MLLHFVHLHWCLLLHSRVLQPSEVKISSHTAQVLTPAERHHAHYHRTNAFNANSLVAILVQNNPANHEMNWSCKQPHLQNRSPRGMAITCGRFRSSFCLPHLSKTNLVGSDPIERQGQVERSLEIGWCIGQQSPCAGLCCLITGLQSSSSHLVINESISHQTLCRHTHKGIWQVESCSLR